MEMEKRAGKMTIGEFRNWIENSGESAAMEEMTIGEFVEIRGKLSAMEKRGEKIPEVEAMTIAEFRDWMEEFNKRKEDEEEVVKSIHECDFRFVMPPPPPFEEESDEEVLGDDKRVEQDRGVTYEINEEAIPYTRVTYPDRYYRPSSNPKLSGCVLHDLRYPVSTLTKLALNRYNTIEGTKYEYVGLVKAYQKPCSVFHYTVRFKARLPDQDPIYFQAMILQHRTNAAGVVLVTVAFVHILPISR